MWNTSFDQWRSSASRWWSWLAVLVVVLALLAGATRGQDDEEGDPCKGNPCLNGICISNKENGYAPECLTISFGFIVYV